MTFDYNKEHKTSMSLVLENGISVEGEFIDLRITVDTLSLIHISEPTRLL